MSDELQQGILFDMENETQTGLVTCLGLTFENDEARRAYFTKELREKLPELKKIEGYPEGKDEHILALSDPPYYTACPNPWINDFISLWETQKKDVYGINCDFFDREPFAADVSEGKNDPLYNVHSYHTKVPYKAIMRYILHYTNPGDIILDSFSGTGMTGVAAQMCGSPSVLKEMGYRVGNDGVISQNGLSSTSKLGKRKVILNDLSPVATHISRNQNGTFDAAKFEREIDEIASKLALEHSWMYETNHSIDGQIQVDGNGRITKGEVNFTVWSDVLNCPFCLNEYVFFDVAVNEKEGKVDDQYFCPNCNGEISKKTSNKTFVSKYDKATDSIIKIIKQVPVLINYTIKNKTFNKKPDIDDLSLIDKIENSEMNYSFPIKRLPEGDEARRNDINGITHVHHFFTKRNLIVLGHLNELVKKGNNPYLGFLFSSLLYRATQMNRIHLKKYFFGGGGFNAGYLKGTLYVSSLPIETAIIKQIKDRKKAIVNGLRNIVGENGDFSISTSSATELNFASNSIDYIFTDPPFGSNIMYSELNFIWESWLGVFTNNDTEAIMNKTQNKHLTEYHALMVKSFKEYFRVLKPGRWITIEFSNSQSSVWNSIRDALEKAGFIIANVAALDKKQGSFKAITTSTAVKQDLVISAYKPKSDFVEKIMLEQNTEASAWLFVQQHLEKLPIFIGEKGAADLIVERTPRILFDRMIAYHIQNGYIVPVSSADFQIGVEQRFPMREGMAFLETQVAEYDKKRIHAKEFSQISLFVSDENSAIEWVRQQLMKKPQTRQELHPQYMKEIQHIAKHEILPELNTLLEQNFLVYEGIEDVPSQVHTYLSSGFRDLRNLPKNDSFLKLKAKNRWYVPDPNKQADLEKLREKSLLREFVTYKDELVGNRKKLKQFRTEAIRVGFKKAWGEKDYQTIVSIGERLPEKVLQEDDKLLMYYDNAQIRLGL
ncbi:DNA methyltransferase [Paenibacillus sp. FSL H8-0079]|uniref:DNA methyltransferase n=1 Tax=Paenibacillus sp. FSL H8-0079 TaxID=2921375 RepID=UPI0030EBF75F